MNTYTVAPDTIVEFWWNAGPEKWFSKDEAFDDTIRNRFLDIYEQAASGRLNSWMEEPTGALALVLLLDQFPRNMFRSTPRAYATDEKARQVGMMALERGDHETVSEEINQFLAMPLMHSENLEDLNACITWMKRVGTDQYVEYAKHHRDIVARFGRFPHRNAIFGRQSTKDEKLYLDEGGFTG